MSTPINIDYTTIDFDALKAELITYLQETKSFKDINYVNSNIRTLVELYAYLGSLFGYYINSVANEPFLPSAKRYKNLNRIARLLSYNPRGDKAAQLNLVGSLKPEYCFGKENVYFEIPAYSSFPSNKATPDGINFSFTNPTQNVYLIKSFGVNPVDITNFSYNNESLPLTKPASYWQTGANPNDTFFIPELIQLELSDYLPLSILNRLDTTNYKKFDIDAVPLFDSSDSSSVGQPFNRNITTNSGSLTIVPNTTYFIVFNYDIQTSTPYLEIMEESDQLSEKRDNIITSIRLEPTSATNEFYTLREVENNAKGRFYVGVLGMQNLESATFEYDKLESTSYGIKKVNLVVNKSGTGLPLQVLVDGVVYSFSSGTISSQTFDANTWDSTQPYYNINLNIVSPTLPEYNYNATLTVESKDPGINSVTIARIYPNYVDSDTSIKAISKETGKRFGNIQVIPTVDVTTSEQKTGSIAVPENTSKIFIAFDKLFDTSVVSEVDYIIELTPSENVQVWWSDKSETGFAINIEPNTGFSGDINWIATRLKASTSKLQPVTFDAEIPTINGEHPDYTIFLSASENVRVWWSDKTKSGFKINTEKQFSGTISYSTFVFSTNEDVLAESSTATQKKGSETFSGGLVVKDITFDVPFPNENYGLHMIANQNVNVWYTNKTVNGFTINVENVYSNQVEVDWYADFSYSYVYQKHGMVNFSGQTTTAGTLPGIRFNNIPETFLINDLKQGDIKLSYINRNGSIDSANNNLSASFTADRKSIYEIKVQLDTQDSISYSDIRVFVKNTGGEWEEWTEGSSLTTTTDIKVGEKVFFVRVNEYQKIEISFGDGEIFGLDPYGSDIIIFGLNTEGKNGNIPPNSIGKTVILSNSILGDDNITLQFEQQFIQLLGIKNQVYFSSSDHTSSTSLYDSEGTQVTEEELVLKQPTQAFGGAFIETTEELRANASSANMRQDRVVSLEDYRTYCNQAFSDYIIKTQVLSYRDIKDAGFLPDGDLAKYWFNYIFIIALPKYGNEISKQHRDYILNTLNTRFKAMATVEHELFSAKLVPIDIRIRYKKTKVGGSNETIESKIKSLIQTYFERDNHEMGETVEYGPIEKLILNLPYVQNAEMAMNKNIDGKLNKNDYNINAVTSINETVQEVKRRKVLELLAKDPTLLNIIDPLFDIKDTKTNVRKWTFSANIEMGKFEFPILGNIIIEAEQG